MTIEPKHLAFCLCLAASIPVLVSAQEPSAGEAAGFQCRWAGGAITIDGKADDAAWAAAQMIDRFYLPWLQDQARPARTATKARLLWDREYLYFLAEMNDGDLFANIGEHDGRLWESDVFELFFKPADDKLGYYEFQVNPAGAVLDMFIPQRGKGDYARYRGEGPFHVEAKVVLDGSLNMRSDSDRGWLVEGRLPWGDFLRTGGRPNPGETWKFALCRYDYSVDFEGPELSTCAPLKSLTRPDFHRWEDYAPLEFIGPDPQSAIRPYGMKQHVALTTSRVVGSPEPPPPYRAVREYSKLNPSFPIYAELEPGSRRLIYIEQDQPYSKSRICRTHEDPSSGEFDVLLELDDTAYSFAFHPRFSENGYVYLGSNGANGEGRQKFSRVTRYTIERTPPHRLLAESALRIIEWPSDGHNGAAVTFGLDGMLYVTSGDGTSDSDTDLMGQGLDHLLAKVLRIDVDHPEQGKAYGVPADNPFVAVEGCRPETWAYGFRNPWRIATDPRTGDIWVGNNGQDLWEQVYRVERGANYGWSVYEGSHAFYLSRQLGPTPVSRPAAEHHHREARSLTGGVVYYGRNMADLHGMYIYGDYSTGKIWAVRHAQGKVSPPREIADTSLKITGFALDAEGELLVLDHGGPGGGFYRLESHPPGESAAGFPKSLAESGLFASVADHRMQAGVIPYSVNSPLWSDGAYKERFLALPGEAPKIDFHPKNSWGFPEGTVFVKSFALEMVEGDPASRKWIETRFFTKQQGEWAGYSYAWNADQTDAVLVDEQGLDREFTIAAADGQRTQNWHFPSRAECMVCHSRAANFVLGASTAQLNKDHDYGEVVDNQLRTLESLSLFRHDPRGDLAKHFRNLLIESGIEEKQAERELSSIRATRGQRAAPSTSPLLAMPPADYDRLADPYDAEADLAARARSYLHVNCASCHVDAGGGNAQINLAYTKSPAGMKAIGQPPLHNRFKVAEAQIIAAGQPDRSILLHRVAVRGTGQMPPLGAAIVDREAVAMLRKWIESLESTPEEEGSP